MSHLNTVIKGHKEAPHLGKMGSRFDPFGQGIHKKMDYPAKYHKVEISGDKSAPDITKSASAARKVTFDLPTDMEIKRLAVKIDYSTTAVATYRAHVGLGATEKEEYIVGGQVKLDISNPRAQKMWGLSKIDDPNTRNAILKCYNGYDVTSTSTAPSVISWTPLPWDELVAKGVEPLVTNNLKKPRYRVTFAQFDDIKKATATGGTITAVSLLVYGYIIPEKPTGHVLVTETKSFDVDFQVSGTALATATSTKFDIKGISGKIKEIFITCTLDSVMLTDFYSTVPLDSIKDKLNNEQTDVFLNSTEGLFDCLHANADVGPTVESTIATPAYNVVESYTIPYGYVMKDLTSNEYGGIHSNNITSHDLYLYQSNGAATTVDIIGIVGAKYVYTKSGGMVKNV